LQVKEITSDGHCLYRAVADQMNSVAAFVGAANVPHAWLQADATAGSSSSLRSFDFVELRKRAAAYIRSHPSEFTPFLGLEEGSLEFEDYCR
jgi:hypothetical protein